MSNTAIRHKLYDYIRVADDKKLYAIYNLLENEIEQTNDWWKNKQYPGTWPPLPGIGRWDGQGIYR